VAAEPGKTICEATFDIELFFEKADENSFIYLTVTDPHGNYANTRAYYLNELL